MKNSLTTIGCICLLLVPVACAHHTCSGKEMVDMKDKGFTVDQIDNMCTSYKVPDETVNAMSQMAQTLTQTLTKTPVAQNSNSRAQTGATTCSTQYGSCPLMQPGSSGAPCACFTPNGAIPGVMR